MLRQALRQALRRSHVQSHLLRCKRQYSVFRVSSEVSEAIRDQRPVVALESTIYTHGFPHPDNAALALSLEMVVRLNGGVPATIAILNGEARVGLSSDELLQLAEAAGKKETMKVSRRDLGLITGMGFSGSKLNGGTTVSGTMVLAAKAGIDVFGTGGLGGVHRQGQDTMDISADLTELGRTPVCVVSSGCKSFLDIPRTLEYLETQGALVATFADGRKGDIDFPAFWTRDSGVRSPAVIQNEFGAASIIYAQKKLGLRSGILFANPIPVEHSIPQAEMDIAMDAAIQEAKEKGYFGQTNTPFILARIKELTGGKSIPANKALVESNVAVATRIAVELSKMKQAESTNTSDGDVSMQVPAMFGDSEESDMSLSDPGQRPVDTFDTFRYPPVKPDIVVCGSIAVDLACDFVSSNPDVTSPIPRTSNPASFEISMGGVGHNVAEAIRKILGADGLKVQLRSFLGDDLNGSMLIRSMRNQNILTSGMKRREGYKTAQYVAVNDVNKNLVVAMADMNIFNVDNETWDQHSQEMASLEPPKCLVVDANLPGIVIDRIMKEGKERGSLVIFEPVSVEKSRKLIRLKPEDNASPCLGVYPNHHVDIATPNEHELAAIFTAARSANYMENPAWFPVIDALGIPMHGARDRIRALTNKKLVDLGIPQQTLQLLPYIPTIITKLGPHGVLVTELLGAESPKLKSEAYAPYILSRRRNGTKVVGGVYMRYYPAQPILPADIKSVNGAGDTFVGVVVAGLASGAELDEKLITLAQVAALMTMKSKLSVSKSIKHLKMNLERLL